MMTSDNTQNGWYAALALAGIAAIAWAGLSLGQGVAAEAEALDAFDLPIEGVDDAEDEFAFLNIEPGFSLITAEDSLRQQVARLDRFLSEEDWAKAFRVLTELDQDSLSVMVPVGEDGRHVLVKERLRRQLLSLPVAGRRAFQLYFDGQANEAFDRVRNHPQPGSASQLAEAQRLVDQFVATSIGGQAASMLGDMYFGQGLFDRAEEAWRLALDTGFASGPAVLELQAKRALALQRGGKDAQAKAMLDALRARYSQAPLTAGGETVDALALLAREIDDTAESLDQRLGSAAASGSLLPKPDANPLWHLTFLGTSAAAAAKQTDRQNNWYGPPTDLLKFVPPVVADDERVYFQWLDVVFAVHRETGKILWLNGSVGDTAATVNARLQSHHGDPRNYRIALAGSTLLVTSPLTDATNSPFVIRAYDTANGQLRWSSNALPGWTLDQPGVQDQRVSAVLGQPLFHNGKAYAVVYQPGETSLYLTCFAPATGLVEWTLSLGTAEALGFQYTRVVRMPQPTLLMGPATLYVMTNNAALLAVDLTTRSMKWAMKMDPPVGLGETQDTRNFRTNRLSTRIAAMANTNGSDQLMLVNDTLYAKEHNNKSLYALDPDSGEAKWSTHLLAPDAKLIGVTADRFFIMDRALQSYELAGNRDRLNKNGVQTGSPDHAGAVLLHDAILCYANGKLRKLDTANLDPAGKYDNPDYLGQSGGHLYVFGDLLVAVDTTQITAFKISASP